MVKMNIFSQRARSAEYKLKTTAAVILPYLAKRPSNRVAMAINSHISLRLTNTVQYPFFDFIDDLWTHCLNLSLSSLFSNIIPTL